MSIFRRRISPSNRPLGQSSERPRQDESWATVSEIPFSVGSQPHEVAQGDDDRYSYTDEDLKVPATEAAEKNATRLRYEAERLDRKGLHNFYEISALEPFDQGETPASPPTWSSDKAYLNKVIVSLDNMRNGSIHPGPFAYPQYEILTPRPNAQRRIIQKIAEGEIGEKEERAILRCIDTNVDQDGPEQVFQQITYRGRILDSHGLKFIGYKTIGREGFDNPKLVNSETLQQFLKKYPTIMDFDQERDSFIEQLKQKGNSDEKVDEYRSDLFMLMCRIYGNEQLGFYLALRSLEDETEHFQAHAETERIHEWPRYQSSYQQISRAQAEKRSVINPDVWVDDTSEDSLLRDDENRIYGVFDGAGGMGNAREASITAATAVNQFIAQVPINSKEDLVRILNQVDLDVARTRGYSTATLVKVIERPGNSRVLAYAHVGDSRLYLVSRDGKVRQITQDEGNGGNVVNNALGFASGGARVRDCGEIHIQDGDRIVLCTDGVTGDSFRDAMSRETLGRIVQSADSPEAAANELIKSARKLDDRSAVVFQV